MNATDANPSSFGSYVVAAFAPQQLILL